MRPERAGLEVTAAGIDAGDGRAGPRFEVDGTVLEPRARIAAFGPGLIARLPAARPGFSGGPLFDRQGRFVGMVTALRPAAGARRVGGAAARAAAPAAVEAFALRAAEVRAEVRRLLAALLRGLSVRRRSACQTAAPWLRLIHLGRKGAG